MLNPQAPAHHARRRMALHRAGLGAGLPPSRYRYGSPALGYCGKQDPAQTRKRRTCQRFDTGLPCSRAWRTVKRQAMTADRLDPAGFYFGTTGGELWMSPDEGQSWQCIARHLPEIHAVESAELGLGWFSRQRRMRILLLAYERQSRTWRCSQRARYSPDGRSRRRLDTAPHRVHPHAAVPIAAR